MNIDFTFDELDSSKMADSLIPAIVQDNATRQVLMLAYMNREAFEKTINTGKATFWSRSRGELWTKGETSGVFLDVVSMVRDCDNDTLLLRVKPHGKVCHTGSTTCFGEPGAEGFIGELEAVIESRYRDRPQGAYTTKLFEKGVAKIAQKVGEEAVESVIEAVAGNRDAFIYEASDLMYHYIVLLRAMGLSLCDIETELSKRHK